MIDINVIEGALKKIPPRIAEPPATDTTRIDLLVVEGRWGAVATNEMVPAKVYLHKTLAELKNRIYRVDALRAAEAVAALPDPRNLRAGFSALASSKPSTTEDWLEAYRDFAE